MKQHMIQAKTQYQNAWLITDDMVILWYDGTWSVMMKKTYEKVKTQYQNAWLSMDDMSQAKNQYQNVEFSMDEQYKLWYGY